MLMGRRCEQRVTLKPTKRNRRIAPAPMPRDDLSSAFPLAPSMHLLSSPCAYRIEYVCSVGKSILTGLPCDSSCVFCFTCFEMGEGHTVPGGVMSFRSSLKIERR